MNAGLSLTFTLTKWLCEAAITHLNIQIFLHIRQGSVSICNDSCF